MLFFDPLYLLLAAPGLILALIATVLTRTTFSKSAMTILLRHFRQKYFGLSVDTYILWPHEQCANPLNRCTGGLPGFYQAFNCSSTIRFT